MNTQNPQQLFRLAALSVLASTCSAQQSRAQAPAAQAAQATVTVQAGSPGKKISTDLLGIFFEDINYAADGGLYAELIQNRSFEYSDRDNRAWSSLTGWDLVQRGGGKGSVNVESSQSLHPNNPQHATLRVEQGGSGVGLMSSGVDGIPLKAGESYNFSCFALQVAGRTPLVARLESKDGKVYGEATIAPSIPREWRKFSATIVSGATDPDARLVLQTTGVGVVSLDMVSLFPQKTFRNRPNGLRSDVGQAIADLKPKFVRFPGGCLAHGSGLNNMYHWKSTVGPVERRKGQRNLWGYGQSAGLGYFEYFQFCEDIGAKPLPVVAAGVSCQFAAGGQQCIPMSSMDEYIQDVLDLVEWANGPVTSTWGAKRAAAGHAKPFGLKYLAVGNEDAITPEFRLRFDMIQKAVRAKYPGIEVIGTSGPFADGGDFNEGWKFARQISLPMVDEHYYVAPEWMLSNINRYDSYSRKGPKVYLGEYASRGNTMFNALAEAAYMTGLERNGDLVSLASYAPLLGRLGHTQWNPNLIYFDGTTVFPTVNYYVQKLYGTNAGDTYLPSTVSLKVPERPAQPVGVYLGTWNTQAQFDDARVQSGAPNSAAPLLSQSFDAAAAGWSGESGAWTVADGAYAQSTDAQPALSRVAMDQVAGLSTQSSYTYSVRARKTGGAEGFLVGFGATDPASSYWWNIGGWDNTQHAIQKHRGGSSILVGQPVPGKIETGRWYDIKVVVTPQGKGQRIQCYLDGTLIHDLTDDGSSATDSLAISSVRDSQSGDIILKLVNPSAYAIQSQVNLARLGSVKPMATRIVLAGDPAGVNDAANPRNIVPQTAEIAVGKSFAYDAPPHSFTVIRLKTR